MLTEGKDKIQDLFSSKLQSFEPDVPASIWKGLDQILSAPQPAAASAPAVAPKPKFTLAQTITVAASIVAAVVIAAVVLAPSEKVDLSVIDPFMDQVTTLEPLVVDEILAQPVSRASVLRKPTIDNLQPLELAIVRPETPNLECESFYLRSKQGDSNSVNSGGMDLAGAFKTNRKLQGTFYTRSHEEKLYALQEISESNKLRATTLPAVKRPIQVGISSNFGVLSDNTDQLGGVLMFSKEHLQTTSPELLNALFADNANYKLDHNQPISFGLTLSKEILPRLSIGTGLKYTYLSSTIKSNSIHALNEKQSFHYLGIPVSVDYIFWQSGRAQFYSSVGFLAQKDIHGSYASTFKSYATIEGNSGTSGLFPDQQKLVDYDFNESISQSKPQFSTFVNIGVSYPIVRNLYLYGTVGGAYYFDANNKYRTIFSDRSTQLDVNLGLRIGL